MEIAVSEDDSFVVMWNRFNLKPYSLDPGHQPDVVPLPNRSAQLLVTSSYLVCPNTSLCTHALPFLPSLLVAFRDDVFRTVAVKQSLSDCDYDCDHVETEPLPVLLHDLELKDSV